MSEQEADTPKARILIVDDSPANLQLLMGILAAQGYAVHPASEGELALRFVRSTLPDLILLDILMPEMDGYQVCQRLKADQRACDIPIIFLTAVTDPHDKAKGFQLGAVDYITKPFQAEEVLARVSTHLSLHIMRKRVEAQNAQLQQEISERQQAEAALRESEELHRLTLGNISDAVFLTDDTGAFTFVCPNADAIFGYTSQELEASGNIARLLGDGFFDPAELDAVGEISNIEREIVDKAGNVHCALVTVKRVSVKGGTRLFTCRDITERKRADMALRDSEARYRELFLRTQADLTKIEALYRVNRSLIVIQDLRGLLQAIVDSMAEALPANRVVLITLDLEQHTVIDFVPGGSGAAHVVNVPFDELWNGLAGWALREMQPALSPSAPDPREGPAAQRRRAVTHCGAIVTVPLRYRDKTLGTITAINCPDERVFTQQDVELVMAMASQAAIAIEHARLYEELRLAWADLERRVAERTAELATTNASLRSEIVERKQAEDALRQRLKEMAVLRAIAMAGTEATSEDELLGCAIQVIGGVLSADQFGLWLVDETTGVLRSYPGLAGRTNGDAGRRMIGPQRPALVAQVIADGQARRIPDVARQNATISTNPEARSMLCVPLKVAERVIGALDAESMHPDAFGEDDERLLTICAGQLATALDRLRLFQAEAQRRREAETLREVAAVISATIDRSEVLDLILEQLSGVVSCDSASIMLLSGDAVDIVAQRGLCSEKQLPTPIPVESLPHVQKVLQQRRPLIIPNTASDPRWRGSPDSEYIRCWLGVPLVIQERVIGLLNLDKAQPGFYTERDAELALAFAHHAAIAIENASLFDQIRRRTRELEALVTISSALRQAQTREEMLPLLIEKSIEVVDGDAGALLLTEENTLVLAAGRGLGEAVLGRQHPPGNCTHRAVARTGEPLFISEPRAGDELCPCEICRDLMQGMTSAALIPLKTADGTAGVLHIAYRSRCDFPEEDRRLLITIAEIAGNALQRAAIMETLEQRVADRTRELAALYDLTAVSSKALDLRIILERSLARVLEAMQSTSGAIHLLGETDDMLSLAVQQGIQLPAAPPFSSSIPLSQVTDWVVKHGEPFVLPHLVADPEMPWASPLTAPCAYAGVPMRVGGQTLGVLSVLRDTKRQFNVEEVALLATIADQVAVSVENARLHKQAERAAVMEERARLARELHDSVTQSLYSVTLLADATRDFAESGEWDRAKHYMSRISENTRQALKEMRLLIYELRPPLIERDGLVEALSQRLNAVEGRAGVEVRLLAQEWNNLPVSVEEDLYLIAQEALNNALKHASATEVMVQLRASADGVSLEVVDNGKGFNVDSVRRKGGMGLLSMRQRAERLGGRLTILSAPGQGTSIKVDLRTPVSALGRS